MSWMYPTSRGFNSSLGYQGAFEDHYSQQAGGGKNSPFGCPGVDLWHNETPAYGYNGTYGDQLYHDEMQRVLRVHHARHSGDVKQQPFFIYMALQVLHGPQQVPPAFADYFRARGYTEDYSLYNGMGSFADQVLGNLTSLLHELGLYSNTLVVVLSDNGGPARKLTEHTKSLGGNNYPLRGGKTNLFEGGVRTVAFATGGFVPEHARGSVRDGMMHICDWYATLSWLAGVDVADNTTRGYPDVDGLNLWPYLVGDEPTSPRVEMLLGAKPLSLKHNSFRSSGGALIKRPWKYIRGVQSYGDWWAPVHPGDDTYQSTIAKTVDCSRGCLFNIEVRVSVWRERDY
jgi:arylsulfatase B